MITNFKLFETQEETQMFIDILSDMSPTSKNFKKYYDILLNKYGVDFNKINKDEFYIDNVDLNDIKTKSDFLSFDKYIIYAKKVFGVRKINIPLLKNREISFEEAKKYLTEMKISVEYRKYTGSGNHAAVSGSLMYLPDSVDLGTLIHELGHVFDNTIYKDGVARIITNASSSYGIAKTDEVFAENFTHFFMNPSALKAKLPEVYSDLNNRIPNNWKDKINKLLDEKI